MTTKTLRNARRFCHPAILLLLLWNNSMMIGHSFVAQRTVDSHSTYPQSPLFALPSEKSIRSTSSTSSSTVESTTSTSSAAAVSSRLSPLEAWCVTHMDVWYSRSLSIKCPFLKRRTADLLDGVDMMMRFLLIRHKSLDLIGPPPGCRSSLQQKSKVKQLHTTWDERMSILRQDWRPNNHKGYYITGRLNTSIYRDDCFFDGPDPDMPVKGLRKYLNAASNLFDHATSTAELLSLELIAPKESRLINTRESPFPLPSWLSFPTTPTQKPSNHRPHPVIVAHWKLQGVLHLPWHPKLPVWTGRTKYHFDDQGLIFYHEEEWDISVAQAFLETLLPDVASKIWSKEPLLQSEGDEEERSLPPLDEVTQQR